jgi:hypothetical protein
MISIEKKLIEYLEILSTFYFITKNIYTWSQNLDINKLKNEIIFMMSK